MEYTREILVTLNDEHIQSEHEFLSVLRIKGIKIDNDQIIFKSFISKIEICVSSNYILNISTLYLKITSDVKNNIEHISEEIHSCFNSIYNDSVKIRVILCDISTENSQVAYKHIHETENLLRKLMSLSIYPHDIFDWFRVYAPKDIISKIKRRNKEDGCSNDDISIYNTDFGELLDIFTRTPSYEHFTQKIDLILNDNEISKDNLTKKLKKSLPSPLWDKYIKPEVKLGLLNTKWKELKTFRNKIAHNKIISTIDLGQIISISGQINHLLKNAIQDVDICIQHNNTTENTTESTDELDDEAIETLEVINSIALGNIEEEEIDSLNYWFFNTNETYAEGAYKNMLINTNGVISIYGYENEKNLKDARAGQKVLAYVNKRGILAVGTIISGEVRNTTHIFSDFIGRTPEDEFCLDIKWEVILSEENALSFSEAAKIGYPLPVRSTFCKLYNTELAKILYETVISRNESRDGNSPI